MRLRNLTIKGFKSFANETSLNFNEDVIGVVGPNGSGKSNVVDAIRWVLGEQKSRELRLEKMTDVIFNGTRKKREAPTAQVTLTFENDKGILPTEYTTVAISRILYRSGESEYRLNDVKCRLKDITTLLLDTGMGSNSYAIIALGMVDDILSDKDDARRQMFEQAAGVSKYKKRKKDTNNKLKSTTADLDRVEDLLFEIEGNLKSLEKQARRAQKYLDVKANYKESSILGARLSIRSLKGKYKDIGAQLEKEKLKYGDLDVLLRTKEAEVEKFKKDNIEQELNLSSQQKGLNELISDLRNMESEKGLLEQKLTFKEQSQKGISRDISEKTETLVKLNRDIANLKSRLDAEKEILRTLQIDVESSKNHYDKVKSEHNSTKSSTDSKIKAKNELNEQVYQVDKKIAITENNVNNLQEDIARYTDTLKESKISFDQTNDKLEKLNQAILLKTEDLNAFLKKEKNRALRVEDLQKQRENTTQTLSEINRKLDSKQNEYDLLKSMIDNLEGFPESVKYLSNNWKNDAPILSDLLDVEDEYKAVIEQYLENFLNYYIVDNVGVAIEAINMLSNAQKGKANFFLLEELPNVNPKLSATAYAKPARYFVNVDKKYEQLLDYLLAEVMVYERKMDNFDDLDSERYIYLSKSGGIVKSRYAITGGSVGLFQGKKIGRKKSLEKLAKSIKALKEDKIVIEKEITELKYKLEISRKEDLKPQISNAEKELNNLSKEQLRLNIQTDNFIKLQEESNEKESQAKLRIKSLNEDLGKYQEDRVKLKADLENIESQSQLFEDNLEELDAKLSGASEQYNDLNIKHIRQGNLVDNIEKDHKYNENRYNETKESLRRSKIRVKDNEESITELKQNIESTKEKLSTQYIKKAELEAQLGNVEQSYYEARNTIVAAEDEVKVITRNQNQIQLVVQKLKDDHSDVKFKISSVAERLKIEFDISVNDFINDEIEVEADEDEVKAKVEKLRGKLSKFGDINPMAVEAYNEMKERNDHIVSQRDDILEAKESLIKTMKEIEDSATKMFMESFHKVRENFITVFRNLFSEEDDCDLLLIDPDNPLESDIEIIAKPKGKKPKSLSQLSGGEKTLTATALLFALYLLKPAPFCIFDEVDAPLDDANIQKFNKIIKKFSEDSQFIIVTHNKATMSAVDVLYGVYMQEQGISSVTPVDFRNLENQEYLETIA